MSREEKSRAAGSLIFREGEKKFAAASSAEPRGRMRLGCLGSSEEAALAWSNGRVGRSRGCGSEGGEFTVPITQAGIFKAALGTRMLASHSFLLGIPNPPGCFENPSLTS